MLPLVVGIDAPAHLSEGVELVDEDDRRLRRNAALEQVSDPGRYEHGRHIPQQEKRRLAW